MTDVYLDSLAATMPDAADQLRHLADTGHRLLVIGAASTAVAEIGPIEQVPAVPAVPASGSWLLTADAELCADRRPGMTTLFLGPRPTPSPRPAPRCDTYVRDLSAAVLEILRHEAMG
jgi:hypothetical protein